MLVEKGIFHGQGGQKPCLVQASLRSQQGEGVSLPWLTAEADLQDQLNQISLKTRLISA